MSVIAEFSVLPVGVGESISKYVAQVMEILEDSGLPYKLGPMGTSVEGEWDEVFGVIKQCYERLSEQCRRLHISIKVDWRTGPGGRLESKIASVQEHLNATAKT